VKSTILFIGFFLSAQLFVFLNTVLNNIDEELQQLQLKQLKQQQQQQQLNQLQLVQFLVNLN
jgi:hypothetical protein